eukprot:Em0004g204a
MAASLGRVVTSTRSSTWNLMRQWIPAVPQVRELHSLKQELAELIPKKQNEIKELKAKYKDTVIGDVTVDQIYGGMRDIKALVTETSLLDANEGIRFRGYSIAECQKLLPKAAGGEEPLPEGVFYLLLTGNIPSKKKVDEISQDWASRAAVPQHVVQMLNNFPSTLHPMSQLSAAVTAMNSESKFVKAYSEGVSKTKYWESTYEDAMDLIAKLPTVAAIIYRNLYRDGKVKAINSSRDWSANFAAMLGYDKPDFIDMLRLYLTIHCDHEGGNAGMNGLAGPLHGLANQEVLIWLSELQAEIGMEVTNKQLEDYLWKTLNSGRVVPGFGHAVLRKTDPRYICQREFSQKHLPNFPLFKVVSQLYEVAPKVLTAQGKTKNPWPNVDAHSGVLLQYYGMTEMNYYTVLFGVSRALGVLSSLVWDRALGFPIERPKSLTTEAIKKELEKKGAH